VNSLSLPPARARCGSRDFVVAETFVIFVIVT
jgi:hypothetical protein